MTQALTAPAPAPVSLPAPDCVADPSLLDSHKPLRSQADLDQRVRQLVPCAVQRQLWLILLDADDIQLPVMIPIGDLPLRCRAADGEGFAELLPELAREFKATSFVFIVERPGSASPRLSDRHWFRFLLGVAEGREFRVRGVYLAHDDGIAGYRASDIDDLDEPGEPGEPVVSGEPGGDPVDALDPVRVGA